MVGPWRGLVNLLLRPSWSEEAYEPLVAFIHFLLYKAFGLSVFPYRLSNLFLHWANALLVLALFRTLLGPKSPALWLTVLFALYPGHTEVLAIATFKKHLLVTGAGLVILHALRPWTEAPPSRRRLALAAGAMVLALLTKETALLLPPLALLATLVLAGDWRARLRRDAPFYGLLFGLGALYAVLRAFIVVRPPGAVVGHDWALHWLTSAKCLFWYLREILLPWRLCQEHSVAPVAAVLSPESALISAGLLAAAAAGAWLWRRDRLAFLAYAAMLLSLAPYCNVVPFLNVSLVANRYLYLPSIWVFLLLGRLSRGAWRGGRGRLGPAPAAACALALFYALLGTRNLALYADPIELWRHAASCAPSNPRAVTALALSQSLRREFGTAEEGFARGIRLSQGTGFGLMSTLNLAHSLALDGKPEKAVLILEALARHAPVWPVYRLLGVFRLHLGRDAEASRSLRKALAQNPFDGITRFNMGLLHLRAGREKAAEAMWRSCLLFPDAAPLAHHRLGELYAKQGRRAKARRHLEITLAFNPMQPEAINALARLYGEDGQHGRALRLYDELVGRLEAAREAALARPGRFTEDAVGMSGAALEAARRDRAAFLAWLDGGRLASAGRPTRP